MVKLFEKGQSGNPGGRPKGLAAYVHKLCGKDGRKLVDMFWAIAQNPAARERDRIEAGKVLFDRGWNKAPQGIYFTDESRPLLIDHVNEADIAASRKHRDDPDAD